MKTKLITFAISLVAAFALWLYVITAVSPGSEKTYYNVPVQLQNEGVLEGRGLMITSSMKNIEVDLRLSGNRTDLDILNNSNITVNVDVSNIYEAGEHEIRYSVNFPGEVPNNAISTQKRTPDTVTVVVEERSTKTINVVAEYDTGALDEDYFPDTDNVELVEEFQIIGPKRIVDQVDAAKIVVKLEKDAEKFDDDCAYFLVDKKGNKLDLSEEDMMLLSDSLEKKGQIPVSLRVLRLKEVKLEVTVIEGGGATEDNTEIIIEPATIQIAGSEQLLKDLEVLNIGTVDLSKLLEDTTLEFEIIPPDGTVNKSDATTETTTAKVDIRFQNLRTTSLTITQITPMNVPEGMSAQIITKALTLDLRGPKALIDTITEEDVKVTVDFTNAQTGTSTMEVKVEFAPKFAQVGAVAPPTITAKLQKGS